MRRRRFGLPLTLALAFLLLPAGAVLAQEAGEDSVADDAVAETDRYARHDGRRDRFYLNIGTLFLSHNTVDELNARDFPLGAIIDWEDAFGLPESTSSFRVEAHFKLAPRHRFRASYFQTARSADRQLIDEEIQWGELLIPIDVRVNSKWNTKVIRGDYRFSVIQTDRVDLGVALGVYLLKLETSLGLNETPLTTNTAQSVPLPMIGLDVEWDFARNFVLKGGFQLMGLKIGDETKLDGNWAELRARVEWMPLRNFGLGVGYLSGDVSVDIAFANGLLQNWMIDYRTGGLTVYALASF
jgi:hypothetical protein